MAPKKREKKIFVLDTNIPLHDADCIKKFEENDIYLPVDVLEELDRKKIGQETINYNARSFIRSLDKLDGSKITSETGSPIGDNLGNLRVVLFKGFSPNFKAVFFEDSVDNRILSLVYDLANDKKFSGKKVILVTKDVSLRLKAKALNVLVEDYQTDVIDDISVITKPLESIKLNDENFGKLMDSNNTDGVPTKKQENQYFIVQNSGKKFPAKSVNKKIFLFQFDEDAPFSTFGIKPKNIEQKCAIDALFDEKVSVLSIVGSAGTGKTLISLAAGLQQVRRRKFDSLFFSRKTVGVGNSDIGYIPGDISDKLDPYMKALTDNLQIIKGGGSEKDNKSLDVLKNEERIVIESLTHIRGRSLQKVCFIIDEAQNLTPHEVKTILTRAAEGTKIIFLGDIFQIDSPYLDARSNGLSYLIQKLRGQDFFAHIALQKSERSRVAEIAGKLL